MTMQAIKRRTRTLLDETIALNEDASDNEVSFFHLSLKVEIIQRQLADLGEAIKTADRLKD